MTARSEEVLAWLLPTAGVDAAAAASARQAVSTALLSAPLPPAARAQKLVVALSNELDELRANAEVARRDVGAARDAAMATVELAADAEARDAWNRAIAAAHEDLDAQVEALRAAKVAALEAELVAGDVALEAILSETALAEDAAALLSDDELAPRADSLRARLADLCARAAALPSGPVAEATLAFLPASPPPSPAAAPSLTDAQGLLLGSLVSIAIAAADLSVTSLRLPAPADAQAPGEPVAWEDLPLLLIDLRPGTAAARCPALDARSALAAIVDRGLLKVEASLKGAAGSADGPADALPLVLRLEIDPRAQHRIAVIGTLQRIAAVVVTVNRITLRGEAVAGAVLPMHVGFGVNLRATMSVPGMARSHYQQPCVTLSGAAYIPNSEEVVRIDPDGVSTRRIPAPPSAKSIRVCAFDESSQLLFLGTNDGETSVVVALVSCVMGEERGSI